MKIILNKDVQNLGEEGDVKEVAPGYARNYLIPKGLGVTFSKQNLALLEGKRNAIEKRKAEKKQQAEGLKERIEALSLQITMTVGENGRLFGSVTNAMISEELAKIGIEVERKRVEIPDHTIKNAGNFVVKVKLYGNEVASLKVTVAGPAGAPQPQAPVEGAAETNEEPAADATQPDATAAADAAVEAEGRSPAGETEEPAAEPADEALAEATQPDATAEADAAAGEPANEPRAEAPVAEEAAADEAAADEAAPDEADEEPADRE